MSTTDQTTIKAGVAKAEITPPLELGFLSSAVDGTYAPFESVRVPLYARVIVLKSASGITALVSLDLLGLTNSSVRGWQKFKDGLSNIVEADRIIITSTHTHSAPETVALSDLYLTDAYQSWLSQLQQRIREAIGQAIDSIRSCRLSVHERELRGYSLQRRVRTSGGIVMSHDLQPVSDDLMAALPVDRRVHTISFKDLSGKTIARIVHAICHPVHEMCLPHVSPDFPGEMCMALDAQGEGMALFLNGALGDTNPPTVSCGPASARAHGEALAMIAADDSKAITLEASDVPILYNEVQFDVRQVSGVTAADARGRFKALRLGNLAMLFLPGEPFVEIAKKIEESSPFDQTIVAALAENNIGYIPVDKAFEEGGYEIGPGKWSFLPRGTDEQIITIGSRMLEKLYRGETGPFIG